MIKVRPEFPIVRDVIESGQHYIRTMGENEKVKCRMCNNPILIDTRTVHVAEDGRQCCVAGHLHYTGIVPLAVAPAPDNRHTDPHQKIKNRPCDREHPARRGQRRLPQGGKSFHLSLSNDAGESADQQRQRRKANVRPDFRPHTKSPQMHICQDTEVYAPGGQKITQSAENDGSACFSEANRLK